MGTNVKGDLLIQTELLTMGIKSHLGKLQTRGIDQGFVDAVLGLKDQLVDLEGQQEALKSRLKEKTAELAGVHDALSSRLAEARKLVKIQIPQTGWKEFGISDVR